MRAQRFAEANVLSSDLMKTKATTNNKPTKTTKRGPATLINASEPHPRFQRRYRPTSFQVARGLHTNAHALCPSGQVRALCTES